MPTTNKQALETKQLVQKLKETVVAQPTIPIAHHYRDAARSITQNHASNLQDPTQQETEQARQSIISSGFPALINIQSSMKFKILCLFICYSICVLFNRNHMYHSICKLALIKRRGKTTPESYQVSSLEELNLENDAYRFTDSKEPFLV